MNEIFACLFLTISILINFLLFTVLEQVNEIIVLPLGIAWNPPPSSGRCQIEYMVDVFAANELVANFITTDLMIEYPFVPCAQYSVRITPHHLGRTGPTAEVSFIAQDVGMNQLYFDVLYFCF